MLCSLVFYLVGLMIISLESDRLRRPRWFSLASCIVPFQTWFALIHYKNQSRDHVGFPFQISSWPPFYPTRWRFDVARCWL